MALSTKFLVGFLFVGEVVCFNFTIPSPILINSTKTSTEVPKISTDVPKSSTTNFNVTLPPTFTSTVKNKPVTRNFKSKNDADEEKLNFCTCNLKRNYCDINCCCDKDCTTNDKSLFKFCEIEKNIYFDSRYCDYIKHIYINNTQFEWQVNQNGLFCIVKSNLPASYLLQKKNPLKDANEAESLAAGRYSWMNDVLAAESEMKEFGYGKPIWILNSDNTLKKIGIPTSFVSPACIVKQDVQFLRDFNSKCIQFHINEKNLDLDISSYVKNVFIISSPKLFNGSLYKNPFQDCPKNICIPINAQVCNFEFGSCKKISTSLPVIKCESNSINNVINNVQICQNVVKFVRYKIYHDGSNGIKKADLFVAIGKLFFENNFKFIQEFSVEFDWFDETRNYSEIRSGNPGYITGKPILIAQQSKSDIIRRGANFSENFLVLPANIEGYCILEDSVYIQVEFGYNLQTKCTLEVDVKRRNFTTTAKLEPNVYCRKIKEIMMNYWISPNTSVGMFGNANAENLNDWTPILLDEKWENFINKTNGTTRDKLITCTNLFSKVVINIYYARVDIKNLLNQPKILGIHYKFMDLDNYTFNYEKTNIFETRITSEVTFFDVTISKKKKFVDPPSFRITLPYDFFYPFVKLQNNSVQLEFKFSLIFIVSLLLLIF